MDLTMFTDFWAEYGGVIMGIGGTIITVGGILLTFYLKFKPILDNFKTKLDDIKNKVANPDTESIKDTLLKSDLAVKIAELEDKINNPLTSDTSRAVYQAQVKILIETKTKLDAGLIKAEEISKY